MVPCSEKEKENENDMMVPYYCLFPLVKILI
jgi:hypothetical protein